MTYTFPAGFGVLTPFPEIPDYQKRILQWHWDLLTLTEQTTIEANIAVWEKAGSPGGWEKKSSLNLRHPKPADGPSVTKEAPEVDQKPADEPTPQSALTDPFLERGGEV